MGWSFTGGLSNTDADVDTNRNLLVNFGNNILGSNGGHYSVTGTSGAIAVSLASNTFLMSMYVAQPAVSKKVYINRIHVLVVETTAAANTTLGPPGSIGIQKYVSSVAPTGGTARTINAADATFPTSLVTDVRDSNAALTGTAPTFGNVPTSFNVPLFVTTGAFWYEFEWDPEYPIVLVPGEGLALRTQTAMPALQQWMYSYGIRWFEK
jgi:hypothetical protein